MNPREEKTARQLLVRPLIIAVTLGGGAGAVFSPLETPATMPLQQTL